MKRLPAAFVSHGSPMVALEDDSYTRALGQFGNSVAPRAIVVVSAHWQLRSPMTAVCAVDEPPMIYDFGGFPDELYQLNYSCPGDPILAAEIARLLTVRGIATETDTQRGIDHGAWVPLRIMFPAATIPVVQLALPGDNDPEKVFAMGQALASLRDEGILVMGSGGAVHNLGALSFDEKEAPVPGWAKDFDDKVREHLARRDWLGLINAPTTWKGFSKAHPSPDHYLPLVFTLGLIGDREQIVTLTDGFQYGTLSMFSFRC